MRPLRLLDAYRDSAWENRMGGPGDDLGGAFKVRASDGGSLLRIIASSGEGWDHVSVSLGTRCPTWGEMEQVKALFFRDDETAMQLRPALGPHQSSLLSAPLAAAPGRTSRCPRR